LNYELDQELHKSGVLTYMKAVKRGKKTKSTKKEGTLETDGHNSERLRSSLLIHLNPQSLVRAAGERSDYAEISHPSQ